MTRRRTRRRRELEALLATREIVVFCGSGGVGKTSTAAAAALGGGDPLRRPRARRHDRPGTSGSPTRSASRASGTSSAGSPTTLLRAAGIQPRGELWAAMLDTKRVVGRPRAAPRARRGDRVPHPRQPAVPQRHGAVRAEPRLHRDGAAVRHPRDRLLRPDRHRHAADPQRDRLPRRAEAHGRLLRWPAAALAHDAVPHRWAARRTARQPRRQALLPARRPDPRRPVPAGHRRVLPQLRDDVRRASSSGPRPSSGCSTTGARPSRS